MAAELVGVQKTAPANALPEREAELGRIDQEEPYGDEDESEEEEEGNESELYDDYNGDELLQRDMDEVNDQDWDVTSGDLTKRYNRMRHHVQVTHGAGSSSSCSTSKTATAPHLLPAANRKSQPPSAHPSSSSSSTRKTDSSKPVHSTKFDDQLLTLSARYSSSLNLSPSSSLSLPGATGVMGTATRKGGTTGQPQRERDKADRATNEQVLDPRTRLILFKMLGRGLLSKVEGCVSTGKEANVYRATAGVPLNADPTAPPLPPHLALKIYKTSILTFKRRSQYVDGEFRFRTGYTGSGNARKMVRQWAEKEVRNLRRLRNGGVRCPTVVECRENVLVMEFLGSDDDDEEWDASPRLKDALIPSDSLTGLYHELLSTTRIMYHTCRLVHADLSEYNILYHRSHLYIIDVSQSVEHDHPAAWDFLRKDLENVEAFFARRGARTLGLRRTFEFVY